MGKNIGSDWRDSGLGDWFDWAAEIKCKEICGEPIIARKDDGLPRWVDRNSCLGNAVVPQIPEMIGLAILEVEDD